VIPEEKENSRRVKVSPPIPESSQFNIQYTTVPTQVTQVWIFEKGKIENTELSIRFRFN